VLFVPSLLKFENFGLREDDFIDMDEGR
jgi:hypothetical protein